MQDTLIFGTTSQKIMHYWVCYNWLSHSFTILDRILSELHRHFDKPQSFVLDGTACSLKSKEFLKLILTRTLVKGCPDELMLQTWNHYYKCNCCPNGRTRRRQKSTIDFHVRSFSRVTSSYSYCFNCTSYKCYCQMFIFC